MGPEALGPASVLLLMEDYRDTYTSAAIKLRSSANMPYDELVASLFAQGVFYGDSYLNAFARLGVNASQVVPASIPLQRLWAREHQVPIPSSVLSRRPLRWAWTRRRRLTPVQRALDRVVEAQIEAMQPEVVWAFSGIPLRRESVQRWNKLVGTTALWWSCQLEPDIPYADFGLILSCIEPLVVHFRQQGLRAELMAHAFDRRVLDRVTPRVERLPKVAFVGNLTKDHGERIGFLDELSRCVSVDFYGGGVEFLPDDSPLRRTARGPAWGDDLYRVYGDYELVIHKNIDVAGEAASAKRLFEATGMGATLLVEDGSGLADLFELGSEVLPYRDLGEAIALAKSALDDQAASRRVGGAGQARTLGAHTYDARVAQFLSYS